MLEKIIDYLNKHFIPAIIASDIIKYFRHKCVCDFIDFHKNFLNLLRQFSKEISEKSCN